MKRKKLENDLRDSLLASSSDPRRLWETLKNAKPRTKSYANYIAGDKWFEYFHSLFTTQCAGLPITQTHTVFDNLVEAK